MSQIQYHHANEAMKCSADGEPWPCRAFMLAAKRASRREADRPLVIQVDPTPSSKKAVAAVSGAARGTR